MEDERNGPGRVCRGERRGGQCPRSLTHRPYVPTGLPAVFVAVWVSVRATLANTG